VAFSGTTGQALQARERSQLNFNYQKVLKDSMTMPKCTAGGVGMSQNLAEFCAFKAPTLSLLDCLVELEKYGNPRLSKDDNTWYCGIEVFVIGEGTSFKVRSEFDHETHTEASNLCYVRLMAELKRIKETE